VELTEQSLLDIPATFATGLTDLLADPDSVRQAIVLNEVLHRPVETLVMRRAKRRTLTRQSWRCGAIEKHAGVTVQPPSQCK